MRTLAFVAATLCVSISYAGIGTSPNPGGDSDPVLQRVNECVFYGFLCSEMQVSCVTDYREDPKGKAVCELQTALCWQALPGICAGGKLGRRDPAACAAEFQNCNSICIGRVAPCVLIELNPEALCECRARNCSGECQEDFIACLNMPDFEHEQENCQQTGG